MRARLDIPIILRRVEIHGPAGIREIDVILDTGAVYTVIAWDVAKDIGYDPAISRRRTPIITANGVIEAPLDFIGNRLCARPGEEHRVLPRSLLLSHAVAIKWATFVGRQARSKLQRPHAVSITRSSNSGR